VTPEEKLVRERATAADPDPVESAIAAATPRVSLVVPVYNEGPRIVRCLEGICDAVTVDFEILVVHDMPEDDTVEYVEKYGDPRVRLVLNSIGPGPARAIRAGFLEAKAPTVVVTMADGSDTLDVVDEMVRLVERGFVIVAGSRYMPGGAQIGGPLVKRTLSRLAGLTLYYFARVGTRDATNSFKAYSRAFINEVGVESDAGFEVAIELVSKARRMRKPVAEVPTIWLDRSEGESRFQVANWLPVYLRWYWFAFGPPLRPSHLRAEH
jgi:glycosyltransferase involved in cell wall biosynthesis